MAHNSTITVVSEGPGPWGEARVGARHAAGRVGHRVPGGGAGPLDDPVKTQEKARNFHLMPKGSCAQQVQLENYTDWKVTFNKIPFTSIKYFKYKNRSFCLKRPHRQPWCIHRTTEKDKAGPHLNWF